MYKRDGNQVKSMFLVEVASLGAQI